MTSVLYKVRAPAVFAEAFLLEIAVASMAFLREAGTMPTPHMLFGDADKARLALARMNLRHGRQRHAENCEQSRAETGQRRRSSHGHTSR